MGGGVGRNAAAARLVFRRQTLSPLFGWPAVVRHRVKLSCWTGPAVLGYDASHRLVPCGMRGTVTFAMSLNDTFQIEMLTYLFPSSSSLQVKISTNE